MLKSRVKCVDSWIQLQCSHLILKCIHKDHLYGAVSNDSAIDRKEWSALFPLYLILIFVYITSMNQIVPGVAEAQYSIKGES